MSIVGIDVGLKRIGLSVSFDKNIVFPSKPIFRKNRNQASKEVSEFIKEKSADIIVVGLPKGGSSEKEMERRIKHFVSLLDFNGKIYFQDEYGSSQEAKNSIKGVMKQKRDGKIDSLSAVIILQRWFEKNKKIEKEI